MIDKQKSIDFKQLNQTIIQCRKCPRLVAFRKSVPIKETYEEEKPWRKPLPGFGDPRARLLIIGLAPSAQGGNRTGRIFTGDPSGKFLFEALFKAGFANQPSSRYLDDGLKLKGCYITAAVKCVPPQNKPLGVECQNCRPYLEQELSLLKEVSSILALGKLAYETALRWGCEEKVPFKHGASCKLKNLLTLYGSYHPSPQNTYTKKLTETMLVSLLSSIKKI